MQSEDDARSVVVVLTAEGEALRGSFAAISKKLASRVYSPLSKDEGEMLEKLLNKVLSNLEAAKNAESAWRFHRKFDIRMTFPLRGTDIIRAALRHGALKRKNAKGTNR